MNQTVIRHGDVLLKRIPKLPKNLKEKNTNILAYGEATGHNHQLVDVISKEEFKAKLNVYLDELTQKTYVEMDKPMELKHQEHKTLEIPAGTYEVVIEREHDPFTKTINQVID